MRFSHKRFLISCTLALFNARNRKMIFFFQFLETFYQPRFGFFCDLSKQTVMVFYYQCKVGVKSHIIKRTYHRMMTENDLKIVNETLLI